jgi:hypothetical protein
MTSTTLLLTLLMCITLIVVLAGFIIMATGNRALNKKYGNKLMVIRVVMQAAIVLVVAVLYSANK